MKPTVDQKRTVKLSVVAETWGNSPDFDPENYPYYGEPGQAKILGAGDTGCTLANTCPGCGKWGGIGVGFGVKPDSPSWLLTKGNPQDPTTWTLTPSIFCKSCCGWHGHLTDGVFVSC